MIRNEIELNKRSEQQFDKNLWKAEYTSPIHQTLEQHVLIHRINLDRLVKRLTASSRGDVSERQIKKERRRVRQALNRWLRGETTPKGENREQLGIYLGVHRRELASLLYATKEAEGQTTKQLAVRLANGLIKYLVSVKDDVPLEHREELLRIIRPLVPKTLIVTPGSLAKAKTKTNRLDSNGSQESTS